jgi:antirestriction protein ArdC
VEADGGVIAPLLAYVCRTMLATSSLSVVTIQQHNEEIVAELTAAFLSAHLGIKGELRHAGYIQAYLDVSKGNDRAFFRAAAKAQQSAGSPRSFSETAETQGDSF